MPHRNITLSEQLLIVQKRRQGQTIQAIAALLDASQKWVRKQMVSLNLNTSSAKKAAVPRLPPLPPKPPVTAAPPDEFSTCPLHFEDDPAAIADRGGRLPPRPATYVHYASSANC